MTPKIKVELSEVRRCSKPGCKKRHPLHRHHVRNEALFLGLWKRLPQGLKSDDVRVIQRLLRVRYYEFRPRDVVDICDWHHAEIHLLYDRVRMVRDIVYDGTTRQVLGLMREYKKICREWLKEETPGTNPKAVFRKRRRRPRQSNQGG
jgi:hypothetical protein